MKLNDVQLTDVSDLRNQVAMLEPGSTAMLHIIREGREKKVQVTVAEQPSGFSSTEKPMNHKNPLEKYGLTLQELTPELAEKFDYQQGSGLIVADVKPGSPADSANLKPGYLVEEVDRVKVRSLNDLKKAMEQAQKSEKILLRVRFGDYSTYVVLVAK